MYFDLHNWWRVLCHTWGLRHWPGRRRMLLRLTLAVPLSYLVHTVFFLLDYLFFPRLWTQRVEAPVFIIGHARSGTTLMHRLMSADSERFSYFLYWEMFFPSLLEKKLIRALGRLDRALLGSWCRRRLEQWDEKTFGPYRHMHNMSLWNAEEDCFAMASAFVTQQWSLEIPLMDVMDVFHLDQMGPRRRRWMRHYRELVKRQLLLNGGERIHLSKNPVMSGWVESLIDTFPGARFVVMLRDPVECIPSCLKLVASNWKARRWQAEDYARSLEILTDISFEHFHHPREVLAAHPYTLRYLADYRRLVSEPDRVVMEVYEALQLPMSDNYAAWLNRQAEREKQHHSKFEYSLGEFNLPRSKIERELAEFYAEYQWSAVQDPPD